MTGMVVTLIWLLHIGNYGVATLSADFAGRAHHTEMADTGKIAATPAGQAENPVAAVVAQVLDIAAEGLADPQPGVRATRPSVIVLGPPALLNGHDAERGGAGRCKSAGPASRRAQATGSTGRSPKGLSHIVIFSRRSGKALDVSRRFFTALGFPERLVARLFDTEKPARTTCCTTCPTPTKLRHTPRHSIGSPANFRARAGTSPGHLADSAIPWPGRCSFREGRPLWTLAYVSRRASC